MGLIAAVNNVVAGLHLPHVRTIVTNGSVARDEFDGTLENLAAIQATLKKTPHATIEAMVAHFNPELTAHVDKFNAQSTEHPLPAFHHAQVFAGFVSTLMAKSRRHK
jgi:hypothetical protein